MDLMRDGDSFWLVHDGRAHLAWSPSWRAEVPQSMRFTHVGAMGEAHCIGWSDDAPPASFLLGATWCTTVQGASDVATVEAAVIAHGGGPRPHAMGPGALIENGKRLGVAVFKDHTSMR